MSEELIQEVPQELFDMPDVEPAVALPQAALTPASLQAYCFGCKKEVDVLNGTHVLTQNNRLRLAANCENCNRSVSKFVKKPSDGSISPVSTSPSAPKKDKKEKKDKSQRIKNSLKRCSACLCHAHNLLLEEQKQKEEAKRKNRKSEAVSKKRQEISKIVAEEMEALKKKE